MFYFTKQLFGQKSMKHLLQTCITRTGKVLEKVFKHVSIVFFYNLCTICKVPGYQRNRRMATVLEFSSASMDVNVTV